MGRPDGISALPALELHAVVLLVAGTAVALGAARPPQSNQNGPRQVNPNELIRTVVANELSTHGSDSELWRFRQLHRHGGQTEEFEYVETPKGDLHRLVARNGQPLTADETRKEDERIEELVRNPRAFQRQMRSSEEDAQTERHLVEMLPSAFEYQYVSRENNLVKLSFKPQPSFRPEHREGVVFHNMEGTIWIDPAEKRIAGLEGRLINEVKFGGGFLGHLAKGGTFAVHRRDVGNGHWELTSLDVNMNGRMLLLKTINVHNDDQNSNFRPVRPGITLEEASDLLKRGASSGAPSASLSRP